MERIARWRSTRRWTRARGAMATTPWRCCLQFDTLEPRWTPAVLGLDIQLFDDVGNAPGAPLTGPVTVGDTFWVEIQVADVRNNTIPTPANMNPGIVSLPLDLTWDPNVVRFMGDSEDTDPSRKTPPITPDAVDPANLLLTSNFLLQRRVDDFVEILNPIGNTKVGNFGELLALRGADVPVAGARQAIGQSGREAFARLRFEAVGAGQATPITMTLADSMSFADATALDGVADLEGNTVNQLPPDATVTDTFQVQAAVSGRKFNDLQADGFTGGGVNNGADPGLANWTIQAYVDADGNGRLSQGEFDAGAVATATTAANGAYQLNLDSGAPVGPTGPDNSGSPASYIVVEVLQTGWTQTSPTSPVLDPALNTGATALGSNGYALTIDEGSGSQAEADFGNNRVATDPISLSGFVYADANRNNLFDLDANGIPLELGLPNVEITLLENGQAIDSVRTGADGWYHFEIADPGVYSVVETQPARFADAAVSIGQVLPSGDPRGVVGDNRITDITLAAGDHAVDYNFGELPFLVSKRMFLASTRPAEAICELTGLQCVTVETGNGDNNVEFEAVGDVLRVTVDGVSVREIDRTQTDVVYIDTQGGQDTVTLRADADDLARLVPSSGSLRRGTDYAALNFACMTFNAEEVVAVMAPGGNGLTVLRDTPQNDDMRAGEGFATRDSATLANMSLLARVVGFQEVRALSVEHSPAEVDEARIGATDFLFQAVGDWTLV